MKTAENTSERLPTVGFYFRFYGDSFDPAEITRRLEVEPTTYFRPGDPITKDGEGKRRGYGWILKVGGIETIEINEMLRELREQVGTSPTMIRQLCDDLNLEVSIICGVGQHENAVTTPALCFPPDFLAWVSDMGASLDVDVIL